MISCSAGLRRSITTLLLVTLLAPGAWAAQSNIVATARDQVSIVSATKAASGRKIDLGLLFRLAPDWHI
jgi:DsbC/DsbD-like thiol-disulfide interchange protein